MGLIPRIGLAVTAFFGFGLFVMVGLNAPQRIQSHIETHAISFFDEQGFPWAKLTVDGRILKISGEAPSDDQRQALETAFYLYVQEQAPLNSAGVTIETGAIILARQVQKWKLSRLENTLLQSGRVPSDEARRAVQSAINEAFSTLAEGEDLVLEDVPAPETWVQVATTSIKALSLLTEGEVFNQGTEFTITGIAPDKGTSRAVESLLARVDAPYTVFVDIESLPAPSLPKSPETTVAAITDSSDPSSVQPSIDASDVPDPIEDAARCAVKIKSHMENFHIRFLSSSTQINRGGQRVLTTLAEEVRTCEPVIVLVEGHTDATGSEERNRQLSRLRAQTVASFLHAQGVGRVQLESEGFGSSRPLSTNRTAAGRAVNRRIEFTVLPINDGTSLSTPAAGKIRD
ncbi:MAG: OmpA family protein [Pseudomonadota bacterium]